MKTMDEFLTKLTANRDSLVERHSQLLAKGQLFAAEDLLPRVQFACRALNDALMGL